MATFHSTLPSLPKPNNISTSLHSNFLPINPPSLTQKPNPKTPTSLSIKSSSSSSSTKKLIKCPPLDRHVVKQNKIRFVQKLKTLLLSKPKHYIPLPILSKCRSYLSLHKPHSLLSMIHRYPTIFQLLKIPSSLPSSTYKDQLFISLTPQASLLFAQELSLKHTISNALAIKLQKLLMLSCHRRILLSKLVHLATDLGLPPNFRSRLCNDYPERFKTVETSYGRALELVSWDPDLANPLPMALSNRDLIVDRPLKFKQLRLRKGLNVKRKHKEFLIKFEEMPEVNPYCEEIGEGAFSPESIEAEKRACGIVREVLGMMVEKRTLVDHLTHFRKEFNLSNKARGMLVRHPELFYVSLKGQRDSVFLVEGYDDKGNLLEKDELLLAKERLMELVREGKRMRRERRNRRKNGGDVIDENDDEEESDEEYEDEDEDDSFENLFEDDEWEDYSIEDDELVVLGDEADVKFWTVQASSSSAISEGESVSLEHW